MQFHIMAPSKNSLKVNFGLIASAFILSTLVICTLTLFASNVTRVAFNKQDQLLKSYHLAFDTSSAVHELLYRSADLSNSLSDQALDDFLLAKSELNSLPPMLEDKVMSDFIKTSSMEIVEGSLLALDHYLADDRKAGDEAMDTVREVSRNLHTRVLFHQNERLIALEAIAKEAIKTNETISWGTTTLAIVSVLAFVCLFVLVFRMTIRPIEAFVDALKKAANKPGNARKYRINLAYGGEIGEAANALNTLLSATQNALAKARDQAEIAKTSEDRWKTILNLAPDAIVLVDNLTGNFIDTNPSARKLFGMTEEELARSTSLDFHGHEETLLNKFMMDVELDGLARSDEMSCQIGKKRIPVSAIGVDFSTGSTASTMIYIRDMSEIVAQQNTLKRAQQEADQASEAKSAFLATMSHEIRTPLNGMMGMAQVLNASNLAPDDKEHVDIIIESGEMLLTILNDVLDFSKINASQMQLSKSPEDLEHLIKQTQKLFHCQAEEKGLELEVNISQDFPKTLTLDPVRVRQCIINLVSNAIKFTKQGKVSIHASICRDGVKTRTVTLAVQDSGIGMTKDTCERIFSSFVQADNSTSREYGGTGLGLSISQKLALLMDGDIRVESQPGKGSVFTFTFQADEVRTDKNNDTKSILSEKPTLSSCKVLLVDDSPTNRKVICTLLKATGVSIVEAENGQIALDLLAQQTFDTVLLDMHMPVLNGPDTIVAIRASNEEWHDIPVIAVTADAEYAKDGKFREMGMDGYVSKPVDLRLLVVNLFQSLSKPRKAQDKMSKSA